MTGYFLDTNHLSALWKKKAPVVERIESFPDDTLIVTGVINLGEIEFGHAITQTTNQGIRDDYDKFINLKFAPTAIEVQTSTRRYYATIGSRVWEKYGPSEKNKKRTERVLVDLGIDVNDLWCVALAWERGLVFVTNDKMEKIRSVVDSDEVKFENWLQEGPD